MVHNDKKKEFHRVDLTNQKVGVTEQRQLLDSFYLEHAPSSIAPSVSL